MKYLITLLLSIVCLSCSQKEKGSVLVLSSRGTHLIEPLFQEFTKKTGIKVEISNNKAGVLFTLLKNKSVKADLLLTTDLGSLVQASKEEILEPVSFKPEKKYPLEYVDSENKWFGLSKRTRVIFFNPKVLEEKGIDINNIGYESLGEEMYKNTLCLRTSKKVYNQALVADLISRFDEAKTLEVIKAWQTNLAAPVFASDREVIKAVSKGKCLFGIANSYYLGKMESKIENVKIHWSEKTPAHVNLSGIGLVKDAPQKKNAEKLIKWLMSKKAQGMFASVNFEYPVRGDVKVNDLLTEFGTPIVHAPVYLKDYVNLHSQAMSVIKSAGYK